MEKLNKNNSFKVIDFYKGFEGEGEFRIIQKSIGGKDLLIIKLWEAYFDVLINQIKPNKKGSWEGFTLHYHLNANWEQKPYQVDDLGLFLDQLESIDLKGLQKGELEKKSLEILKVLKKVLKETIEIKGKIFVDYY